MKCPDFVTELRLSYYILLTYISYVILTGYGMIPFAVWHVSHFVVVLLCPT